MSVMFKVFFLGVLCISLLGAPDTLAETSNTPTILKQRNILVAARGELQTTIRNAEQKLHQIERDRYDKLEELEQLYTAYRAVSPRYSFSKDANNEIAAQAASLNLIEKNRADCLADLDCLYASLSRLSSEIAKDDKGLQ